MKRISILVLILCVCFVSVAWGEQQACTAYTPWAQFHKLNMRRWNRCEKVLGVNNVGRLGLKWSYSAGSQLDSSPAVVSGVVFFGSFFGNVYALKAKTAGLLWSYTTGAMWIPHLP
jgi:outer membrane protein assembly factor BamB